MMMLGRLAGFSGDCAEPRTCVGEAASAAAAAAKAGCFRNDLRVTPPLEFSCRVDEAEVIAACLDLATELTSEISIQKERKRRSFFLAIALSIVSLSS